MPIAAVIFDLDDTLIDWWGSVERCLRSITDDRTAQALLDHCRTELWSLDPTESFIWHRNTWAIHHLREQHWPVALPDLDERQRDALMARFAVELWVDFFPETVAALDALHDRARLAVLSNNHLVADESARLGLDAWFEVTLHATAPTHKPHPEAFSDVLEALGLMPGECLYVGDSVKADVNGALAAGLVPVWVDRWDDGWADRPSNVHRVRTLAELPALLDTL